MKSWQLDPAHSQIAFAVKHMMVTTVRGRFDRFQVDVDLDESDPTKSSVVARIDAGSINTGMDARDQHLRGADFFDAAQYPEITFRSTRVERHGDDARVHGDLTIRGETRPVTLDVDFNGIVPNMQGGRRAAFEARTRLSRKEWGLNWNVALESGGWLVSDDIKVEVDVAFVQAAEETAGREHAAAA
jgi:polyisoprenoid-binding protein YceI